MKVWNHLLTDWSPTCQLYLHVVTLLSGQIIIFFKLVEQVKDHSVDHWRKVLLCSLKLWFICECMDMPVQVSFDMPVLSWHMPHACVSRMACVILISNLWASIVMVELASLSTKLISMCVKFFSHCTYLWTNILS